MKRAEKAEGKLIGLSKARTKAWFDFVYKSVGASSVRDLEANLESKGAKASWLNYSSLTVAPKDKTLLQVEKVVPRSSYEYIDGPGGLPLWPILEGDTTRPKLFLTRTFSLYDMYSQNRTLVEKWGTLARLLIDQCVGSVWAGAHREFDQLVQDPLKNDMRIAIGKVDLAPKFLLAIIALAVQSYGSEDKTSWDYANYFMSAIDGEPIKNAWGASVAEYLANWIKDRS